MLRFIKVIYSYLFIKKKGAAKFSVGDQVSNGSTAVFMVKEVVDSCCGYSYKVSSCENDNLIEYHEDILDMVYATYDSRKVNL